MNLVYLLPNFDNYLFTVHLASSLLPCNMTLPPKIIIIKFLEEN